MANVSSLLALANGVRARFRTLNPDVSVAVTGWRARFQHLNQGAPVANRVCFIPGRPNGTDAPLERPRHTSSNPRNLLGWNRIVTVSVWACDPTQPANDEAQIAALEDLLEQTIQAIHTAVYVDSSGQPLLVDGKYVAVGLGNLHWGSVTWTVDNKEMGAGKEVLVELTQRSTFFDVPLTTVTPTGTLTKTPVA